MEIHNAAEDIVLAKVHEIFDEEERVKSVGYCTCGQCRLDVACYVLNRISPEYVISGRGLAHAEIGRAATFQREVDLVRLVHEGITQVSKTKRPHFPHTGGRVEKVQFDGPAYNFPTVIGRIFNGKNFEPMSGIALTLFRGGSMVAMVDANWQNPCTLVAATAGTFIFWPAPEKAESLSGTKTVDFELVSTPENYEEFRYFFTVALSAETEASSVFSMQRTFKLPDLFIFPKE
jgi:competence protein ComFB